MVDIFTALLGIISICALGGAVFKVLSTPPKIWDDEDCQFEEIESSVDYKELRGERPHIWMD